MVLVHHGAPARPSGELSCRAGRRDAFTTDLTQTPCCSAAPIPARSECCCRSQSYGFSPKSGLKMHVYTQHQLTPLPTEVDIWGFLSYLTCVVFSSGRESQRPFVKHWTRVCSRAPGLHACPPAITVRFGCKPAFSVHLNLGFFKKESQSTCGSGGRTSELR